MTGRKITLEQKELIQGVFFNENTFFNCLEDVTDSYFIMLSVDDENSIVDTEWSYLLDIEESECILKEQIINNSVVVNIIDVNYLTKTVTCIVDGVNFSINYLDEFTEAKGILEEITGLTINSICGDFDGKSVLNINEDTYFDCNTIESLSKFESLKEIFACVKYKLMNV